MLFFGFFFFCVEYRIVSKKFLCSVNACDWCRKMEKSGLMKRSEQSTVVNRVILDFSSLFNPVTKYF